MTPLGKTIQIYCPSGDPRGVRIAEITTRIVQAVVFPRLRVAEALKRPELSGVGVYYLFGAGEPGAPPIAYIGEAEDCGVRFKEHIRNKEFWTSAVAIVSRTASFTKAHGLMLEYMSIQKARAAGRYVLDNGNKGSEPTIPEWLNADVHEVFESAEVLLSSLGYHLFEREDTSGSSDEQHIFYCRRGGAEARGVYNEDGLVVLEGSIARKDMLASSHPGLQEQRDRLVAAGTLEETAKGFRFTRNWPFSSPSAAASVLAGGSANGWIEWKDDAGRTLDEVYRSSE